MKGMVDAITAVLEQGIAVLESLDQQTYGHPFSLANGATIGAHYRHSLEHFRQLMKGMKIGVVDYDARSRDIFLETNRDEALSATRDLRASLKIFSSHGCEDPMEVRCGISYGEMDAGTASSSLGREIMFCISHAIHHYALIAMILRSENLSVPEGFGLAPSTARHRLGLAGAR
jgi:hypothetical protein